MTDTYELPEPAAKIRRWTTNSVSVDIAPPLLGAAKANAAYLFWVLLYPFWVCRESVKQPACGCSRRSTRPCEHRCASALPSIQPHRMQSPLP